MALILLSLLGFSSLPGEEKEGKRGGEKTG